MTKIHLVSLAWFKSKIISFILHKWFQNIYIPKAMNVLNMLLFYRNFEHVSTKELLNPQA
jgi:hypothetical protein